VEIWGIVVTVSAAVLLAEWLLMQSWTLPGLLLYSVMLILLLLYSTFRWPRQQRQMLVFTIPAVSRLMAFTLPLGSLSPLFAQLVVAVPVGLTAVFFVSLLGQEWPALHFAWRRTPYYLFLIALGAGGGLLLFQFQQPTPLIWSSPLILLFNIFVLVILMAFLEEWLFREIMQTALTRLWGDNLLAGFVVAFFYTALSLGQGPWPFILLIFVLTLALSWLRRVSNSLLSVSLLHGALNLTFFLILPGMANMGRIIEF